MACFWRFDAFLRVWDHDDPSNSPADMQKDDTIADPRTAELSVIPGHIPTRKPAASICGPLAPTSIRTVRKNSRKK
jgi:hypothetical protein